MASNYYTVNMQKLLYVVLELHKRGYEKLRVVPSLSPSGLAWRCSFVYRKGSGLIVSTWMDQFSTDETEIEYTNEELTDLFERKHSDFLRYCRGRDTEYVEWYGNMLQQLVEDELPFAFAEYFSPTDYWKTTNNRKIQTLPDERRYYYNY